LTEKRPSGRSITSTPDYYEFLQISRNAEPATIHRVYQFLAARFHPDNAQTGDVEKFMLLKQAYEVLSNPERRAQYDAASENETPQSAPLSDEIDFLDSIKGELNRRLALLALLYVRRRTNSSRPEVPLNEVEQRMGFPRDYLEFTMWYLQRKGYIVRADNSDFTLTAEGVDFVEMQREQIPMLNKLLTSNAGSSATDTKAAGKTSHSPGGHGFGPPAETQTPQPQGEMKNKRVSMPDRRANGKDIRFDKEERRSVPPDRLEEDKLPRA
jgi:curved DNA-binding protein CbpA